MSATMRQPVQTVVGRRVPPPAQAGTREPCIRTGVIGGWVAIYLCLVGIVPVFNERPLIVGVISLGQTALLIAFGGGGVRRSTIRSSATSRPRAVAAGALVGAIIGRLPDRTGPRRLGRATSGPSSSMPRRTCTHLLTNGMGTAGAWFPIVVGAITGALAGVVIGLPTGVRGSRSCGASACWSSSACSPACCGRRCWTSRRWPTLARFLFGAEGLKPVGARRRLRRDVRRSWLSSGRPSPSSAWMPCRPPSGASSSVRSRSSPWRIVAALPAGARPVLRAGHRPRRAVRAAGPRPQHHAGPRRPAGPGLRRVLSPSAPTRSAS